MGLLDLLTADYATRQQRTRDLNDRLEGLLNYYLGPTGIPDRLSSANALLNPIDQIGEAGANTVVAFDPTRSKQDRMQAALDAGLGTITAAAPAIGGAIAGQPARRALMETITGASGQADTVPPVRADEPRGILAYHGSPYDFDRFSMDKIGTGEGAQAYGHGLYFAENENIARGYRDQLRPDLPLVHIDGQNTGKRISESDQVVQNMLREHKTPEEYYDMLINSPRAKEIETSLKTASREDILGLGISEYDIAKISSGEFERVLDNVKSYFGKDISASIPRGIMYEVNINANPEDFLDWDRPFASADDLERFAARFDAVDPALRKRIEDFGYVRQQMGQPMPDGSDIIREVMGGIGGKEAAQASKAMQEAGIPGIRYLDAGSRYTLDNLPDNIITREAQQFLDQAGGDPDEALSLFKQSNPIERWESSERDEVARVIASAKKTATRNYVVLDENLINIVRKYGIAGAAAMLGVSTMDVEQAMAQGAQPQQSGLLSPMEQ